MAHRFDVRSLFETKYFWERPGYAGYRSMYDEIDDVAAGKKGMSVNWPLRTWLETAEFAAHARYVHDRGLLLVIDPSLGDSPSTQIFVLRVGELWRIRPHHRSCFRSPAMRHRSVILGYSIPQIRAYQKRLHWRAPVLPPLARGEVLYTLLSKDQSQAIRRFGKKAFPTPNGMTFVHCGFEMKRDAHARVPKDITVARFLLDWSLGKKIVSWPKKPLRRTVRSGRFRMSSPPRSMQPFDRRSNSLPVAVGASRLLDLI